MGHCIAVWDFEDGGQSMWLNGDICLGSRDRGGTVVKMLRYKSEGR